MTMMILEKSCWGLGKLRRCVLDLAHVMVGQCKKVEEGLTDLLCCVGPTVGAKEGSTERAGQRRSCSGWSVGQPDLVAEGGNERGRV